MSYILGSKMWNAYAPWAAIYTALSSYDAHTDLTLYFGVPFKGPDTKITVFANSVDPEAAAHNEPHLDLHSVPLVFESSIWYTLDKAFLKLCRGKFWQVVLLKEVLVFLSVVRVIRGREHWFWKWVGVTKVYFPIITDHDFK